ncbi:MAG: Uma2 family endonuclease [Bryobacteraceae bacterium]
MGSSVANALISVEEYLSNPAYEHCEYIDGEIQELNLGTYSHSGIQMRCGRKLLEYFDSRPGGYVGSELHCRLQIGGTVRFRLPDIAVVLGTRSGKYLDRGPDLVVEIRSPEDSIASQFRKLDDYFANGTKLAWIVLPEEMSVFVVQPDGNVRTVVSGEALDGGAVLPDLRIEIDYLFS